MVRRITRKEIKQPDEFISTTTQVINFIALNRNIFLSAAMGILIVAGVILLLIYQGKRQEEKAQTLLYQTVRDFRGPTLDLTDLGLPREEKAAETSQEKNEKYRKAQVKFQEIAEKYPRTEAAWQAIFYMANCQYLQGDTLAAIDSYQKILDGKKIKDNNLQAMITYNLGFLYENMGYMDRAIEYYRSVMEMGSNLYIQLVGEDLKRAQWKAEYIKQSRPAQAMPGNPPGGPNPAGAGPGQPQGGGIQIQLQPGAPAGQAPPSQNPAGTKPE